MLTPLPKLYKREMLLSKQADKRRSGVARGLSTSKSLPAAPAVSGSYIFTDFRLEKLRKQPYFDKDSAGMKDGERRLRKGISET